MTWGMQNTEQVRRLATTCPRLQLSLHTADMMSSRTLCCCASGGTPAAVSRVE